MASKRTIAIIASTEQKASAIVNKFLTGSYRLLLLSKYPNQLIELSIEIESKYPGAEFEVIDCMKDGCWEADIIILDIAPNEQKEVAELIKEVATQKIVVGFSENENDELQNLLKYSKVITAIDTRNSPDISLYGKDEDAVQEVSEILKNSKQDKETIKLSNH